MGKLILVPTPLGNLKDITLRALEVLQNCDLVFCEDTRKSSILLNHYKIEKPLRPYHQHNEHKVLNQYLELINNNTVALITDAGTPSISDPGFLILRKCIENNIDVECLPGPTAFVPALVLSGFAAHDFTFEGFLPHAKGRNKKLKELENEYRTMIFYESPHRLLKTFKDFKIFFGENRRAVVCRELTKVYEEVKRGTLTELENYFSKNVKGEIVIVVEGKNES